MRDVPFEGSVKVRLSMPGRSDIAIYGRTTNPKRYYGRRKDGDVFYVLKSDALADGRMTIIQEEFSEDEVVKVEGGAMPTGPKQAKRSVVAQLDEKVLNLKEEYIELLKALPYIGEVSAEKLFKEGVYDYKHIADSTPEELVEIVGSRNLTESKAREVIDVATRLSTDSN